MIARLLRRLMQRGRPARLVERLAQPGDEGWQNFFEEALAGKAVVDRAGRLVRLNDALRSILPEDAPTAPGTPVERLFAVADRGLLHAAIAAALDGVGAAGLPPAIQPPPRKFVVRLDGPAPSRPVLLRVTALRELDGSASGVILRLRDMSAEASLESQLEHSQRLQVAGQLAGGVAHDFNNLLTAIIGAADAIAGREGIDTATHEDVAAIRASAGRGAALVRQLLAFGRQQALTPSLQDLNAVITDLAAVLRRVLPSSVRLELALEQPGAQVLVDPTALDQVLLNLSVNGRDAMPSGGTLTLRTDRLTLRRALPRGTDTIPPGDYALIEVQDTGRGIAPEVLPHIFEAFFTTRRELGGSGLGLSTVHGIVRQSDGFLAVDSEPGLGTRMRVYLPRHSDTTPSPPPAPQRATGPATPTRPDAPRGTILLVDDEDTVLRIAARSLRNRGWQVLAASSAEAALDMLGNLPGGPPTAVVTDLAMPGMDGAALVRAVRSRSGCPALPAILVSGYAADPLQREVSISLGDSAAAGRATRFLAKPYDMAELAALLEELPQSAAQDAVAAT
jgi:two-component system cell cycle sensor histidine kinase/response regulator CckA